MRYNMPNEPAVGGHWEGFFMKDVRFGIIGLGVQGSLYARILTGHPAIPRPDGCVLTAVSSRSDKSAEAAALGVAFYPDWRELIDSGKCDAVIITVPHFQHHEIAIYALKAGVHVLCEKPACVRASDVQKMRTAEKESGASLGLFLQQRTIPLFSAVKSIINSGELGQLRRSNWILNTYWRPDSYYASATWRGTWRGEGGGMLVNQLPHYLDLWLYLCGMPASIHALTVEGAHRNIHVENDVTVLAQYPGGATGVFVACTHDPMGTDRLELDFEGGKIIVEDSARATIHRFHRTESQWNESLSMSEMQQLRRQPDHHDTEIIDAQLAPGMSHRAVMVNFARHIRLGEPLIATGLDGLHQVELANAIALSGWLEKTVPCPCDPEQYNAQLQKRMDEE